MIRFALLGSGSRGNAALVAGGDTLVMIDCGFSLAETTRRMQTLGVSPEQVDAILVTHEHNDHIAGVGKFVRRYGTEVWMTHGTRRVWKDAAVPEIRMINPHLAFRLGEFEVQPYPVPHDACEPCQFVLKTAGRRIGILSDAGSITPHICEQLNGCDALLLECNHDPQMLAQGPYAESLKQRVAGPWGHLSNQQAAGLLAQLEVAALQHLAVTHISETNNTPELAHAAVAATLDGMPGRIVLANQESGLPWTEIQ